ncbi:MAG: hypothetical protein FWF23_03600 [Alphaproteobacteria bacterium]|nr:hypothetical protein [Alphaproteobacteria bacterium]MCL2505839.1 hypothetical protein [Alphaproteobacteria bacterium]
MTCDSGHCDINSKHEVKHSHAGKCKCGCGCECDCGCGIQDCCDSKADKFLELACEAHHKLLKKKMMAAFEAKIGAKMDRVATLVVDTALVYMKEHMKDMDNKQVFEDKLMEIFKS